MTKRRLKVRPASRWLGTSTVEWEQWQIDVAWDVVDGKATPVGVTVRSHSIDEDGQPGYTTADKPTAVRRDLFKTMPLGSLIEDSRLQLVHVEYVTYKDRDAFEQQRKGRTDSEFEPTYVTVSPSDAKYRRAAWLYNEQVAYGERRPALMTFEQMQREGFAGRDGQELTPLRVRKWLTEARRRGYVNEAGK